VLIELASDLRKHVMDGGSLILSGLLTYDAEEVREVYEGVGFAFEKEMIENEWACLTFLSPHS